MLRKPIVPICLILFMTAGCSDSTEPESQAPTPPPIQALVLDLSFFNQETAPGTTGLAAYNNFIHAAARAAYVNIFVAGALAPPALAINTALNTTPSQDEDGSWVWIYTWLDEGQEYQIRLRGTVEGDLVNWVMTLALPQSEAKTWFTGQTHMSRDEGYLIFSDFEAQGSPEVIRLDWANESENEAHLLITNVQAGHEEEGDWLEYRREGVWSSIEYNQQSGLEDWDVFWNEEDGTGSIQAHDYNQGERGCWNSGQEDAPCQVSAPRPLAG